MVLTVSLSKVELIGWSLLRSQLAALRPTIARGTKPFWVQGYGVYRFAKKYGTNVDGYSPIYTPDSWSKGGGSYKLGVKGLIAWCAPKINSQLPCFTCYLHTPIPDSS